MIIRSEAIVLRSIEYGETSRIVTLFTREKGKMVVMARGARRSNSRFGSTLQPMSYTQVILYYKASREIQTLGESSHVQVFNGISGSLEGISYGMRMIDLVHALMQDEEANPSVFQLLIETLNRLNRSRTRAANLFYFFQLRLAGILGFAPGIDRDKVERITESGGVLVLDSGSVQPFASEDRTTLRRASCQALRAFAIIARSDVDTVLRLRIDERTSLEIGRLIEDFLRYHVEGAWPTRGSRIAGQMLKGG